MTPYNTCAIPHYFGRAFCPFCKLFKGYLSCGMILKPLSDCHDISGDMRRCKASYNSAYIAADGHDLLLKIFGQGLLWVSHDKSTTFSAKW